MYQILTVQLLWILTLSWKEHPYLSIHSSAFFSVLVIETRIKLREHMMSMDCQSICQSVSGCTVASRLSLWLPYSSTRTLAGRLRKSLQRETHHILCIMEFITVIYINLSYLTPLCCLDRMHLSQPQCWTWAGTGKQMHFTAAAGSLGVNTHHFVLHEDINTDL